MKNLKLGSLFDGIGAFPYAASFFGITPLWASEILPNSVSITKKHFPEMAHLGDITKLDGGKIPPVSVICFGSPCQSFSVAGPRTSFDGKSGLFFEAIRIIQEMRRKTNGNYPKIAIFENVPGVLNIDGGRSYKTIIEAFCETEVPMPASGKWANAGMVRGGSVDFAWVVKDAQHYRVPQRRKRLFAIADFTGQRAAEILFKSESLSGYFAARQLAWQGLTADAESGTGSESHGGITAAFMAGQAKNARSIAYNETLSPTLKGAASGLNQTPSVLCLTPGQVAVINDQGGRVLSLETTGLSPTLRSEAHGNMPIVFTQNQRDEVRDLNGVAGCLAAYHGVKQQTYVVHPEITGTLCGSGAGTSRTAGNCNETDLAVAYCLQGNMIGRTDKNGPQGSGVNEQIAYSVTAADRHGVAYAMTMGHYMSPVCDQTPTLMAGAAKDRPFITVQEDISVVDCNHPYVIRRLTPTECERLMAFDDDYTAIGKDGKIMSDSVRYQMLGNSIVVNVLAYIMQNIAEQLGGNPI